MLSAVVKTFCFWDSPTLFGYDQSNRYPDLYVKLVLQYVSIKSILLNTIFTLCIQATFVTRGSERKRVLGGSVTAAELIQISVIEWRMVGCGRGHYLSTQRPSLTRRSLLCAPGKLSGTDQQTARRPSETSPSSACSFNTSGEQHSDHKVNSNILVNGTVSTKEGAYNFSRYGVRHTASQTTHDWDTFRPPHHQHLLPPSARTSWPSLAPSVLSVVSAVSEPLEGEEQELGEHQEDREPL
ncbi:hypothetical protein PAMA_013029 [Pampus argenteus]